MMKRELKRRGILFGRLSWRKQHLSYWVEKRRRVDELEFEAESSCGEEEEGGAEMKMRMKILLSSPSCAQGAPLE
jgi:hypothetical protein